MKTLVIRFYHNAEMSDIREVLENLLMLDKRANIHREMNPVTRWIDTNLSIDDIMCFPSVADCIESNK